MRYFVQLMPEISAEQVGAQVQGFWNAFCEKSGRVLEQMYLPSAIVFNTYARRSEPAQLMLARRVRKFGELKSFVNAKLGTVDVQIAGDMAIASYPYHFHSTKANRDGSRLEIDVPYSRATQIFQADQSGALRILHEHLSVGEPGKKALIPREGPSAQQPMSAPAASAGQNARAASLQLRASDTGSFAPVSAIPGPAASPILADEVRAAVHHCWQALSAKSKDLVEALYFPTAVFFAVDSRRSESARLAIVRRTREFFAAGSSVSADLSAIDVQMAGRAAAIASYTFRFHLVKRLASGKYSENDVPFCRATAVFRRDETGALRILHEHQSTIEVGSAKELSDREHALAR
jgi:ketosteroid isomerase-like protein